MESFGALRIMALGSKVFNPLIWGPRFKSVGFTKSKP